MRRSGSHEEANTLVVEAMLIAILLMAAVLIPTFSTPARQSDATRRGFEDAVEDLLAHLGASPDPAERYPSALDRIVGDALLGNATFLEGRVHRALPTGSLFNLLLDNGDGVHRLRWSREPSGETVSSARLWSPSWGTLLAMPQWSLVAADRGAVVVQAVPVHRSLGLVGEPGVRADVELELPGGLHANRTVFAPLHNRTTAGGGLALAFLDAGAPSAMATPGPGNDTLVLQLNETQGRAVAAGTLLDVRLPPGVLGVGVNASRNAGWDSIAVVGNATYGWNVSARLASALNGATQTFEVNATLPSWGTLHRVEARVENGTLGFLDGVVSNSSGNAQSGALPPGRGPFLSLPELAPWSAPAEAALVVPYADDLGRTVNVTRVTLTPLGGVAFLATTGLTPATGWTAASGSLQWVGSRALASNGALEFRFRLQADAPARGDAGSAEGVMLDARQGYTAPTAWQSQPGVFGGVVQARNATIQGFDETPGAHALSLNLTREGAKLKGNLAYETSTVSLISASSSDAARGAGESWLAVDTTRVALGGTATVRWDVRRAVEELGVQAAQFKCYDSAAGAWNWTADRAACNAAPGALPWQFDHVAPDLRLRLHFPAPAQGSSWPLAIEVTGLTAQGTRDIVLPADSLLGTYVVELRADFHLTDQAAGDQVQRLALLGAFDVHRTGREPAAPAYNVVLQAWLPDWG